MFDYIQLVRKPSTATRDRSVERHEALTRRNTRYSRFGWRFFLGLCLIFIATSIAFFLVLRNSRWDGVGQYGVLLVAESLQDQSKKSLALLTVRGKEKNSDGYPTPRLSAHRNAARIWYV
jgi:hypothetical protein